MSSIQRTASASVDNYEQVIHNYLIDKFNISKQAFNPELLKNGTKEEQQEQLQLWAKGPASLYIRWIPDELASPEAATAFFSNFGKVSRADIVPKTDPSKKCTGNMAFIHFESWDNHIFPQTFVSSYPHPVDVNFNTKNRYGALKTYTLKTCVNTRPVAQVEFNGPQMVDMMNNLETRVKAEMEELKSQLEISRREKLEVENRLKMCEEALWNSQHIINYQKEFITSMHHSTRVRDEHAIDMNENMTDSPV